MIMLSSTMLAAFAVAGTATTIIPYAHALQFNEETGEGFINRSELRKALGVFGVSNQEFAEKVDNMEDTQVFRVFALADVSGTVGCLPPEPEITMHSTVEEEINFEIVRNNQGKLQGIELTGYVDGPNALENAINEPPFNEHPGDFCNTDENGEFEWNTPILRNIGVAIIGLPGPATIETK